MRDYGTPHLSRRPPVAQARLPRSSDAYGSQSALTRTASWLRGLGSPTPRIKISTPKVPVTVLRANQALPRYCWVNTPDRPTSLCRGVCLRVSQWSTFPALVTMGRSQLGFPDLGDRYDERPLICRVRWVVRPLMATAWRPREQAFVSDGVLRSWVNCTYSAR